MSTEHPHLLQHTEMDFWILETHDWTWTILNKRWTSLVGNASVDELQRLSVSDYTTTRMDALMARWSSWSYSEIIAWRNSTTATRRFEILEHPQCLLGVYWPARAEFEDEGAISGQWQKAEVLVLYIGLQYRPNILEALVSLGMFEAGRSWAGDILISQNCCHRAWCWRHASVVLIHIWMIWTPRRQGSRLRPVSIQDCALSNPLAWLRFQSWGLMNIRPTLELACCCHGSRQDWRRQRVVVLNQRQLPMLNSTVWGISRLSNRLKVQLQVVVDATVVLYHWSGRNMVVFAEVQLLFSWVSGWDVLTMNLW